MPWSALGDDGWRVLERITLIGAVLGAVAYVGRTLWHAAKALIAFSSNVARMDAFIDQFGAEEDLVDTLHAINRKLSWVDSRSRALLEESYRVAAFETNLEGHCTWVNRTYLDWTGLTASQVRSTGWRMAIVAEHRDVVSAEWDRAVAERRSFDYMFFIYDHAAGGQLGIRCVAYLARDNSGEALGWIGLMRPVSDERVRSFNGE